MDFENIYKSRAIVYTMLQKRGYNCENYENQTKEELNILFQNHSKKLNYDIDSLDMLIEKDGGSVLVKYVLNDKLRGKIVEKLIETIYENILKDEDTFIIITKDSVNYKGSLEEYINQKFVTKQRFTQIFWLNTLLFDITQHELVPNYRILTDEEKQDVLDKYHVKETLLPNVLVTDPLANFYGVKVGQVVEVSKTSETNGYTKSYRLCVT